MILSLEPWQDEVLEEALKHDFIFADDINLDINSMQFPKRTNNLMFSCFTCSKVFQSQAECKMHISADHEGRKLNYQCPICSHLFVKQSALKEHVERFHKVTKIGNFYQCPICSNQFLNHSALNQHVVRFHKSENIENQTSLKNGSRTGFQCPICLDFFKSEYYVAKHISIVHEGQKLEIYKDDKTCPVCFTVFQRQSDFKRHISSVHGGKVFEIPKVYRNTTKGTLPDPKDCQECQLISTKKDSFPSCKKHIMRVRKIFKSDSMMVPIVKNVVLEAKEILKHFNIQDGTPKNSKDLIVVKPVRKTSIDFGKGFSHSTSGFVSHCTSENDLKGTLKWPEILLTDYHDLYYNRTENSEKNDATSDKIQRMFVGSWETASTCHVLNSHYGYTGC